MADIINQLAEVSPEIAELRSRRPDALANAQLSFEALLEPAEEGTFPFTERYAVAAFVAGIYQSTTPGTSTPTCWLTTPRQSSMPRYKRPLRTVFPSAHTQMPRAFPAMPPDSSPSSPLPG